jgi:cobalt-zinc-cadmium resistance protein CzcA
MLRRLVEFALSQRMLMLVLAALLAAAGSYAFGRLPIDAYPDISTTQVKLILKAPGMTPEEVEQRVIAPLELELLGIPNQLILRSTAKYAIADITIDFTDSTDVYWARQQVGERLSGVMDQLPDTVSGGLAPIATPLSEIFMFTIEGGNLSLAERRTLLDWTIRPALRTIPGVADVNALGGYVATYEVVPNDAALLSVGLKISDLKTAIEQANRNDGAGRVAQGEEALIVRAVGAVRTLDDLREVMVATRAGSHVRLGDVADIRTGALTRYGAVTKDGRGEVVEGLVLGLRGADTGRVVAGVRAKLQELEANLPKGVKLHIFYDRADLIDKAVATVQHALLEATVLIVVLLVLFLGNLRAAMVVALTLPFAAITTFLLMSIFGLTANLMSLGGLAIAIGMLVDAAVVVVENTVEHLSQNRHGSSVPKLHLVWRAVTEVSVPVASGIIIICLVFLPLLSLQGLEGKLFAPVALTIIFALSGSLILSLTLIPVIASLLLKPGAHGEAWLMRKLMPLYSRALAGALARPRRLFIGVGVALLTAAIAYVALGKTFMPTMDEGSVVIQLAKLPSINLERSLALDTAIQKAILDSVPEVAEAVSRTGTDEIGLDPMGLNETDMFLMLKPREEWRSGSKDDIVAALRTVMKDFPGVDFSFTQPIEMRASEMLTGSRGDLAIKLFGPDLAALGRIGEQIRAVIQAVPGAAEVLTVADDKVLYLQTDIDRMATGAAGLTVQALQEEMRARLEGLDAGMVTGAARRTPIMIKGAEDLRSRPELFGAVAMTSDDGGIAHISDVARISQPQGPVRIQRENASRFATIQANVTGRDLVSFVTDAQNAVAAKVKLPTGYRLEWSGEFQNQRRAAARLMVVVPLALGLIFLVLFATLGSVRQSLLILANIPLALIGGVLLLFLSGHYLSVPASVGFIALLGIAVLNGLVLIVHFNELKARGLPLRQVVYEGSRRRLRPVMMTASIAALGLVPLLFAIGPGSEIQKPLAIVVIGGLVTSTLLTLFMLPILFERYGVPKEERS